MAGQRAAGGRRGINPKAFAPDRRGLVAAIECIRRATKTEATPLPDVTPESLEAFVQEEMAEVLSVIDPRPRQEKHTAPPSPFASIRDPEPLDLQGPAQDALDLARLLSHLAATNLNRSNPFPHDRALFKELRTAMTSYWRSIEELRREARCARLLDGIEEVYAQLTQAWSRGAPTTIDGWNDEGITPEQEQAECEARSRLRELLIEHLPECDSECDQHVDSLLLTGPEIRLNGGAVAAAREGLSQILPEAIRRSSRALAQRRKDSPLQTMLALGRPQPYDFGSPEDALRQVDRASAAGEGLARLAMTSEQRHVWAAQHTIAVALDEAKDREAEAESYREGALDTLQTTLELCDSVESVVELKRHILAGIAKMRTPA